MRVYGSVSRCKRVVGEASTAPYFDAHVLAVTIVGMRALVRVVIENGDDPDIVGNISMRYERAAWRIDDFDAQYLRSELGTAVAGQAEIVDEAEAADVHRCVTRGFEHVGDATIRRIAYDVLGARSTGLHAIYRKLATCRSEGISLVRRLFERELRDLETSLGSLSDEDNCILRGLRITTSDELIADVLAAGGVDSRLGWQKLLPKVREVAAACNASTPRRPSRH